MNVRLLKAKRVEAGLRQKDLAKALGITEKAMNHKECSQQNKFKADEMLKITQVLNLTSAEFNAIFFDSSLPFVIEKVRKLNQLKGGDAYDPLEKRW